MKNTRFVALLLVLCMAVAAFTACKTETQNPESSITESSLSIEESRTPIAEDGREDYKAAIAGIGELSDFKLSYERSLTLTVGTETRTENSTGSETYLAYGKDTMAYYSECETIFGKDRTLEVTETYLDGVNYMFYDENYGFYSSEAPDYEVNLFDSELYEHIVKLADMDENGYTVITFGGAKGVELWQAYEYAVLDDASGKVCLDADGNIVSLEYIAKYEQGAAYNEVKYSFTLEKFSSDNKPEITKPENAETYKEVGSLDAVKAYDKAFINLQSLGTYSYTSSSIVLSRAFESVQESQTLFKVFNYGDEYASKLDFNKQSYWMNLSDDELDFDSVVNETTVLDGKKTAVIDGRESTVKMDKNDIDYYDRSYRSTLTYCIPELADVTDVEISSIEGYLTLNITCESSFIENMRKKTASLLGNYGEIKKNKAEYKTTQAELLITVDVDTGYPVAINMDYESTHVYEGEKYEYAFEYTSSIIPANPDIYYEITEKHHPDFDKEPYDEDKAAPLFYKVTDANGNVMWLLGTIHVGDERTAYLPDEIYEAFDASDAAAFEIDALALGESMPLEESEELIELYLKAYTYFYTGETIDKKIDKDLYERAKELFDTLALGTYGDLLNTMDSMRPNYWSMVLGQIYMKHIQVLDSQKGVDIRLLERANEADIEIYEIESSDRQFTIAINTSQLYYEMELENFVDSPRSEYKKEITEMYEAWCDGDIEKLTEMINEQPDFSEMTEEEKKAYEEYIKALNDDRDALMLEKAKEYIASGETVFFAVGLAHLLDNETGLVKTLAEAGYTVELVEYK